MVDQTGLSGRIDLLARGGAILAVLVYGAGFTIVSFHEARFGISAFEVFKPKIFAAGFTFMVLATLATLAAGRAFNVLWWEDRHFLSKKPEHRFYEILATGPLFLIICQGCYLGLAILFSEPGLNLLQNRWDVLSFVLGLSILALQVPTLSRLKFDEHPRMVAWGSVLGAALWLVSKGINRPDDSLWSCPVRC